YATVGGHAWVCDAWKRHHYDNNEYYDYLNMNWGWGGSSNGFYYIDSPMSFNTGSYTFYYGFEMITNIRP
ncbi:MAG: C10 family peptidase, partial [Bacteroidaceae bacterium]|nr:C10 family peptidase [Bacteroidaceae bacterium]